MASIQPFKLRYTLSGTGITSLDNTGEFDLSTKYEKSFLLNSLDSNITLDLSNVENPKVLVIVANGDFTLELTTVDPNTFSLSGNSDFPIIIPMDDTFLTTYPTLEVLTSSESDIEINVRCYGEEVTV